MVYVSRFRHLAVGRSVRDGQTLGGHIQVRQDLIRRRGGVRGYDRWLLDAEWFVPPEDIHDEGADCMTKGIDLE